MTLGGVNVKEYSMNSLMNNFAFVFQSVYLFADTIENNIKFGRQDASHEEVVEAAKKACCHEFISKLQMDIIPRSERVVPRFPVVKNNGSPLPGRL